MARLTKKQRAENEARAERGQQVVEFYLTIVGTDPNAALVDMLADLQHYADENAISFYQALSAATNHFEAEISGSN